MSYLLIENGVLKSCTNAGHHVVIPEGVTSISGSAFTDCRNLQSITIPKGVTSIGHFAFMHCSSLQSISLPEGVKSIGDYAFLGCNSLQSVSLPKGVTAIGNKAFTDCRNLQSVSLSEGVKSIGDYAFSDCGNLQSITIPESVTTIGNNAFSNCSNLQSVTVPEDIAFIGSRAFSGCKSLADSSDFVIVHNTLYNYFGSNSHIVIPEGVTAIDSNAFYDCCSLQSITIPKSVTSIGHFAFSGCQVLQSITLPEGVTTVGNRAFEYCLKLTEFIIQNDALQLPTDVFGDKDCILLPSLVQSCLNLVPHLTDGDVKRLFLRKKEWGKMDPVVRYELFCQRQSKTLSAGYSACMTSEDVQYFSHRFLETLAAKPSSNDFSAASKLCIQFLDMLSEKTIKDIYTALKSAKGAARAVKAMESDMNLAPILSTSATVEANLTPAELLIPDSNNRRGTLYKDLEAKLKEYYGLTKKELPDITYTDGTTASPIVLTWLLTAHEKSRGSYGIGADYKLGIRDDAKAVLAYVDSKSLQNALLKLADNNLGLTGHSKKMYLAYPICRYADVNTMNELLKRAPNWRSYVSGNNAPPLATFRKACLYSEHRAVMLFAEKYGDLWEYARIRGTNADTIRDTVLADLGFDTDGKKEYNLGDTTIVVSLQKGLTLGLFDTKRNKAVKSIPKKGNDEALVAEAFEDFAELKKNVKKIAKNRSDRLFEAFLSGEKTDSKNWKAVYFGNPLLRHVAELIVWQQGAVTFTLKDGAAILADCKAYEITDTSIRVAHPIEMKPAEVEAWQKYFTAHALKQPFAQIWERAIDPSTVKEDRYIGCTVPVNLFRGAEKHGLDFYDHNFHNDIGFYVNVPGCNLEAERTDWNRHALLPDETFTLGKFTFGKYTRRVNHLVTVLDRWTVFGRIKKDDVSVEPLLGSFTLAQIMEFIAAAQENSATNCTALLLNYKNTHFSDFDPMDEFVL